jgi:hypothetical protein
VLGGLLDQWPAARWLGLPRRTDSTPHTLAEWAHLGGEALTSPPPPAQSGKVPPRQVTEADLARRFLHTELSRSRRQRRNQYLNLDYTPKDQPTREALQRGYELAPFFTGDVLNAACHASLPNRWVMASAQGTGSAWHVDPFNASAWNGLLIGRKRWALSPPDAGAPPGVAQPFSSVSDQNFDYFNPDRNRGGWWGITQPHEAADPAPREYFEKVLPSLTRRSSSRRSSSPIECTLRAGELIYIPSGWWHAVLNLSPTVAFTETYTGSLDTSPRGAVKQVMAELAKRVPTAWAVAVEEGDTDETYYGGGREPMPVRCLMDLRAGFPRLFGGARNPALNQGQVLALGAVAMTSKETAKPDPLKSDGTTCDLAGTDSACVETGDSDIGDATPSPPQALAITGIKLVEQWNWKPNERTLEAAIGRFSRGVPLLLRGHSVERWPMMQRWTPVSFFEMWDEGSMPSLRGVQAHSARRPEMLCCRAAATLRTGEWACNGDNEVPLPTVFTGEMRQDAMYWEDDDWSGTRVAKGGGVVGTSGERRYWEGDVADLGTQVRSGIGAIQSRIVDDMPVTDWRDQLLFEYHKKHDRQRGMRQIQGLRKNYECVSIAIYYNCTNIVTQTELC